MKRRPKKEPKPKPASAVRLSLSGGGVVVHCTFSPKDAQWLVGLFTKRALSQQ